MSRDRESSEHDADVAGRQAEVHHELAALDGDVLEN